MRRLLIGAAAVAAIVRYAKVHRGLGRSYIASANARMSWNESRFVYGCA